MMTEQKPDPMADALLKKRKGLKLSIMIGPDEEEMAEKGLEKEELSEDEPLEGEIPESNLAKTDDEIIDDDIEMLPESSELGRRMKEKKKEMKV